MKKIATILLNYNGYADTMAAIESIRSSSVPVDIVLVDNASPNGDGVRFQRELSDVKLILSDENLGFSGGNNLGIAYALENGYEFIVLLNNDTVIAPDMFTELVKYADDNTVTAPLMYRFYDREKIWYGGGHFQPLKGTATLEHENETQIDMSNRYCDFAVGCCMCIPAAVFQKVGLWDESFFMYVEDDEFNLRLKMNGVKILFVPSAVLWHKNGGSSGGKQSKFSIYYYTRNRLNFIKKYKKQFHPLAYTYVRLSRRAKWLVALIKREGTAKVYARAIRDHKRGITGKVDLSDVL